MTRTNLAAAALALAMAGAGGTARAGYLPLPIPLPAFQNASALTGALGGGGAGEDLLLAQWGYGGATRFYPYRDLVAPRTFSYAVPADDPAVPVMNAAVGDFDGDGLGDVVWQLHSPDAYTAPDLQISWGADPLAPQTFSRFAPEYAQGMMAFRALPSPAPPALATIDKGDGSASDLVQADFDLRDLSLVRATGTLPGTHPWPFPPAEIADDYGGSTRLFPLRMELEGRPPGLDDALIPLRQGLRLLVNQTPATATTLAEAVLTKLWIGWSGVGGLPAFRAEPGISVPEGASCHGGGALDVDGDGLRDLVFTMVLGAEGQVLWVRNTGVLSDLAATTNPWRSLMERPGLPALENPLLMRQVDLPGGPAIAFHDAELDEILVVSGDGGAGFQVGRVPAYGATVHDLWTADVVGGTGADLLASVVTAGGAQELWVYPDDGARAPTLAWSPEPPEVALAGTDLTLSVEASDPDSPFNLRWIRPPAPDAVGVATLLIPGAEICGADPVDVTVRAVDPVGLYASLHASIPIAVRPSLVLLGADPPGRLVLAPGGVSGRAEGEAWPACGSAPSFSWASPGLSGLVGTPGSTGSSAWLDFAVPESAYPEALSSMAAGLPAVTLTAAEGTLAGTATLPLALDGRGLVAAAAAIEPDRLAAGEVGEVRVSLASRLSVALPGVIARVRLDGLAFAGAPAVAGGSAAPGALPGELVVDPLPPAPAVVQVTWPVRSAGGPGGASVELFSPGGVRLSPEAEPPAGDAVVPGCGCGAGGPGSTLPIGVALLLLRLPLRQRGRGTRR